MSDNIKTVIQEIDYKVRKLKHDLHLANKKLTDKDQVINELQEINKKQKEEIQNLHNKIKIIKLSKTIENKRDLTETKLKINELVREIDSCINLLNK